jgi:hypothetical protein
MRHSKVKNMTQMMGLSHDTERGLHTEYGDG